ncbi:MULTISPECIES: Zn-ribbon domain-containing OB-fold protein [Rhodococcus erythropolis group]|uniref:Zn-ribbon domain-containing OB-fold protein n=1 Tax=Rhodococcus erythropolis group TaxID=2840174 RepID=UPI001BE5EA7F|nr:MULTISPECIES: Zn-ribbon domain-containing OB-fold protein [Rhodococcus erythropolis group]MBT2266113.1 Zn-ribbon domain-containing OB-fold protein [Rhodococcus erythropolis]MBT2274290.1 Zn-ribbon domain-containing OB-fold protein [Rhodococcus qingshengii]
MFTATDAWTGFVPAVTPETAPFWDAANDGVFLLQRCPDCGQTQYHYRALCSHCWSDKIEDFPSSGRGTVWTYSIVYKNRTPGYAEKVPYIVGLVELEGGVKVVSNILADDLEAVTFGTEVEAVFAETDGGQKIPLFRVVPA